MEATIAAISTVGFPIVMCLILCYVLYNTINTHKEEVKTFNDTMTQTNYQMTEAINNNTVIMEKILTKLDMDENV